MSKSELYQRLLAETRSRLAEDPDLVAAAANTAALLFRGLAEVNWAGFYFLRGDVLVLGPFQGKPACVRIPLGKGVCGTAAARRQTVLVPDVQQFPGHIACDAASRSEIVVPLLDRGRLAGVLDIDSPVPGRFDGEDQKGLEAIAAAFCELTDWTSIQPPRLG